MRCREVTAEHQAAPPAIEADNKVPAIGSVDGDRGRGSGRLRRCAECGERLVDGGDEVWEFSRVDLDVPDIAPDNLGD
jgi:hypothetical protein